MLLLSQKSVEIERCIDGEQPSCQTFMRLLKYLMQYFSNSLASCVS